MYRTIAKLFFTLSLTAGVATAAPIDLVIFPNPDIQVSPVIVDYDASTDSFTVEMIEEFPPTTGPNLVRDPGGTPLAAEDLEISIDVLIEDDGGMPVALPGGTGLSITGTIFDDNTVGGTELFSGTLLEGTLIDVGIDGPIIELAWDLTGGTALPFYESETPGTFGLTRINTVSQALYFDPSVGFSESFNSGEASLVTTTDTLAAAVPLPAGLPLLLGAIISLGAAGRLASRRRAT